MMKILYYFGILQLKIIGREISLFKNQYTRPLSTIHQSLILFFSLSRENLRHLRLWKLNRVSNNKICSFVATKP